MSGKLSDCKTCEHAKDCEILSELNKYRALHKPKTDVDLMEECMDDAFKLFKKKNLAEYDKNDKYMDVTIAFFQKRAGITAHIPQ